MSISRSFAKWFSDLNNENSPAARLRKKRILPLLQMIDLIYTNNGAVNIVDLGGTVQYWNIIPKKYLDDHNVRITLVNLPDNPTPADHGLFHFVAADACQLANIFQNKSFDIAHSNSVVEHVGDWGRMVQFASELKRVAHAYYCQTPNYWFPIEPHCMTPLIHWLPRPFRLWLVSHFQLGHWKRATSTDEAVRMIESARLLNKKMFHALFPDASIVTERLLFLPKSFIAIKH